MKHSILLKGQGMSEVCSDCPRRADVCPHAGIHSGCAPVKAGLVSDAAFQSGIHSGGKSFQTNGDFLNQREGFVSEDPFPPEDNEMDGDGY